MSHLGAELPLAVMGLSEEPLPKVYTGPWFRPEGTCTPDLARVPVSLKPGGPITSGVGADVVASLVILGVSEHLGVGLSLGVVGMHAQSVHKVYSGD